jgi:hypothetical protein
VLGRAAFRPPRPLPADRRGLSPSLLPPPSSFPFSHLSRDCLCRSYHVLKGKTVSKWIINGSGQFPTTCNIPNPNGGIYNVKMYVDEEDNGKNGKPLKVGQKCNIVQGMASEVRGGKVIQADIECSNGVIHVIDGAPPGLTHSFAPWAHTPLQP